MHPTFHIVLEATLAVFACLWVGGTGRRFRSDLREFRTTSDGTARLAIAVLWGVSALIALWLVRFAWELLDRLT